MKQSSNMVVLRDYQVSISDRAVALLKAHGIVYLAMETRTGKTLTAFEAIRKYGAKNVLFVTKKKAIKSIESDYSWYKSAFRCDVKNYESVGKMPGGYDLVVCDEAHSLGAFPKPAKRVKDIVRFTKGLPVVFLSATPTPESYSQIYHQLFVSSFSPFAPWRNFYKWAHEFVRIKKKYVYNRELNDYSDADLPAIEKFTKHLFITHTQVASGFTETIREEVLLCDMDESQADMVRTLTKDRVCLADGYAILGDTAVKMQSKVHQLCSGTVKDEEGVGHIISTAKARFIRDWFAGKKVAVFYKFQAEFDMLKSVFGNWTDSPETFQAEPDRTFLGQFQSAREGIRLDSADAIVFFNIDFSYLSYAQSKDRIVSKERTKEAVLYWVFSRGGIEEKIYKVVKNKRDYTSRHFKRDYEIGKRV